MAAVKGIYGAGKGTSLGVHGVTHNSGKNTPSHGGKVTASAGKNSGTARGGDKKGCGPMKGC